MRHLLEDVEEVAILNIENTLPLPVHALNQVGWPAGLRRAWCGPETDCPQKITLA